MINTLSTLDPNFDVQLKSLTSWESLESEEIIQHVKKIIDNVKNHEFNSFPVLKRKLFSIKYPQIYLSLSYAQLTFFLVERNFI